MDGPIQSTASERRGAECTLGAFSQVFQERNRFDDLSALHDGVALEYFSPPVRKLTTQSN
jgi:hypothetical protein